ncbi:hypothetical protein V6D40_08340 [Corynebacterium sp. Q4381]|uniref:hypothetical protein n=1 Tax=Corynebacterium sp. Marseille-Q4381 TaxID=3121597 RepID=UPI002FE5231A
MVTPIQVTAATSINTATTAKTQNAPRPLRRVGGAPAGAASGHVLSGYVHCGPSAVWYFFAAS